MINNILSIWSIIFISFSGCVKEKNIQLNKSYALILNIYNEKGRHYVDADYVQYYVGDDAVREAKKRGEADSHVVNGETIYSVPDDIYIVNENNKIRKMEVSNKVKIELVGINESKNEKQSITFDDLKNDFKEKLFLLTIENEKIIEIKEIFTP
ncbi:MAG: hypothetical protein RL607_765 [Bacteroidota bacterium]|jgi:uncharacterized protein YqfB (UPF0267 family)